MHVKHRRIIGLLIVSIFLLIYIGIAAQIGNFFVDKNMFINIIFFIFAGLIWVLPLKPLFNWMRTKPHEIIQTEEPPKVSQIKRRK